MNPEPMVFLTALLATVASFADSGWLLSLALLLLALLIVAVGVMLGVRGVRRELDALERYFDRGRR